MCFVVLQHLKSVSRLPLERTMWPYLLRTLLVDMFEWMLCLLAIVPNKVRESCELTGLGIDTLLDCVDFANIMLP